MQSTASPCRTCKGARLIEVKVRGKKKMRPCPACSGRGRGYATK